MLLDLLFSLANGATHPALLITEIAMILFIVLFSLSAHEASHAFAAKRLGDHTAYNMGRISLNPFKHLHPIGFLSMALVGIGWAKPVPINPRNFRDPRKGMMLSSLAGPLSNFCIAVIAVLLDSFSRFLADFILTKSSADGIENSVLYVTLAVIIFFHYAAYLNFSLAIFNLIPCPPFDGSRIFFYFLPKDWYFKVMRYEQYLGIAVLLLIMVLSRIGWNPVSILAGGLLDLVAKPFDLFFGLISEETETSSFFTNRAFTSYYFGI